MGLEETIKSENFPNNPEVEKSILGCCLLEEEAIKECKTSIQPEYFYDGINEKIYRVIIDMCKKKIPVDFITLTEELKKKNLHKMIGGGIYITELVDSVVTSANIEIYCKILCENHYSREKIKLANEIARKTIAREETDKEIYQMKKLSQSIFQTEVTKITDEKYSDEYSGILLRRTENFKNGIEITTGFKKLDGVIDGFRRGLIYILGGMPGLGKTSLVLNMILGIAPTMKRILLFSTEMEKEDLVDRMVGIESGIDSRRLRKGMVGKEEVDAVSNFMFKYEKFDIRICASPGLSIQKVEKAVREVEPDIFFLDHLEDMVKPSGKTELERINELLGNLQDLPREHKCVGVLVSQLNREQEKREKKTPKNSDFWGSAKKEQLASVAMFLTECQDKDKPDDTLYLWITKNRFGPKPRLEFLFKPEYTKFTEV